MYVMSEDGRRLPPFYIRNVEHVEGADTYRIVYTDAHVSTIVTSDYDTDEAAKARLADVVEWLNAPAHLLIEQRKAWSFLGWTAVIEKKVNKPTVYEFGKPIGAWKEAR